MMHATTWMNLRHIMFSARSQSQEATFVCLFYMKCPQQADPTRQKADGGCWGEKTQSGVTQWEVTANEYSVCS